MFKHLYVVFSILGANVFFTSGFAYVGVFANHNVISLSHLYIYYYNVGVSLCVVPLPRVSAKAKIQEITRLLRFKPTTQGTN